MSGKTKPNVLFYKAMRLTFHWLMYESCVPRRVIWIQSEALPWLTGDHRGLNRTVWNGSPVSPMAGMGELVFLLGVQRVKSSLQLLFSWFNKQRKLGFRH